jgi:two-component system sensor histidine kinase/response regulator
MNTPPVILLVDDNLVNLEVLFDLLDEKGFHTLTAKSGELALKRAETAQPDLILLDVLMPPGIDGFETCRRLKAHQTTRDIPVIFMTALSDTVDKVTGFEVGAVDYITKPIQPEEVLARVNAHLAIQYLQQQLQQALAHEQELNRLKSRFMSMALHDLRTPLTSILLTTELLQHYGDRMSTEQKAVEYAGIEKTIKRMTSMLNEFLMLSKAEAGKFEYHPQPTWIEQFCQDIVAEFRGMSKETHTLLFSGTGQDFQATIDPKLLQHVFSNLLSNAIKYSPSGGTVAFILTRDEDNITVQITDQGIGIPEEAQARLFEAYHRAENVGDIRGTGLGLSIVKQFVELHGGTIQVQSEVNKGSTFTVVLPI